MRKITLIVALIWASISINAQSLNSLKKDLQKKITSSTSKNLSEEEIGKGLKEALNKGVQVGVDKISKPDGYFKDPQIKILLPKEAKTVEDKLRKVGQGKLVDDAIESMNRAAEDAATEAKALFVQVIKEMTLQDAKAILNGADNAATKYLEKSTRKELEAKFNPVIKTSLDEVGATKNWNKVFTTYNKIPFVQKVNPDLVDHVTQKALDGLFVQIAKEELKIRKDPVARTTDLLKKVFSN